MDRIIILGSSSKGNCYLLECDGKFLIIEAGVNFVKCVLPAVDYHAEKIAACISTHRHTDHSMHLPEIVRRAIPVYSHPDVAELYKGVIPLHANRKYRIGKFMVTPIPVEHSVPCYAYLIEHKNIGKLLFATDLQDFKYRIKNLDHLFIEANYGNDILDDNAGEDKWSSSAYKSHLEIYQTIDIIKHNISSKLKTICLLHLSDDNSNSNLFKKMVWDETGRICYIAERGLEIELNKEEF